MPSRGTFQVMKYLDTVLLVIFVVKMKILL